MKARTKIPELEAMLESHKVHRWTPEIEETLWDYYLQFASDKDVKGLADYINKKYDRNFSSTNLSKRYALMKGRR